MKTITADSHPTHVIPFFAKDWAEAITRTEELLKQDEVKATVWLQPNFNAAAYKPEQFLGQKPEMHPGHDSINSRNFKSMPSEPNKQGMLKRFGENLNDLLGICPFESQIRYSQSSRFDPHQDGHYQNQYNDRFEGKPIRVIETLHGPGTILFDPDITLNEAEQFVKLEPLPDGSLLIRDITEDQLSRLWHVATGDLLFITPEAWGREKAVVHSTPIMPEAPLNDMRIVRVFDLNYLRY